MFSSVQRDEKMPQGSRKFSRMNKLDEEMLRENFNWNPRPNPAELEAIAARLKMDKRRVCRWFCQRRHLHNRMTMSSTQTIDVEPPKRWVRLWVKEAIVRLQTGNISQEPEVRYVHDEDSAKPEWYLNSFEEIPIDALHFSNPFHETFDRSTSMTISEINPHTLDGSVSSPIDPTIQLVSSKDETQQIKLAAYPSNFTPLIIPNQSANFNELEQLLSNSPNIMDCLKNNNALFLP